jgi:hypothetical protein
VFDAILLKHGIRVIEVSKRCAARGGWRPPLRIFPTPTFREKPDVTTI